jgi:zinc transporter ZupT
VDFFCYIFNNLAKGRLFDIITCMTFLIISALAIFLSVIFGGVFALKFKDKLHLILGFSAGSVIGVAFLDLLPEALKSAEGYYSIDTVVIFIVIGFLIYTILDRLFTHSHADEQCENHNHKGVLGAGSISLHSLLDGIIVGLAFQISSAVGIALAIAIFAHSFSDGINTVNMIVRCGGDVKSANRWLLMDAFAPVMGIILSIFITIPASIFPIIVSIFCGLFIYLGASDLLPESHHGHPKVWTTISTILGITLIFIVTRITGL